MTIRNSTVPRNGGTLQSDPNTRKIKKLQAFVIVSAHCKDGRPILEDPTVVFDRQAAYRYYRDGGGSQVPRGHKVETLETRGDSGGLTTLYTVDIPDRAKYDRAYKLDLVRRILAGEISQTEASRLYGPGQATISGWVRQYGPEVGL